MRISPFWTLHRDLPREGPGEPADVAWAAGVAGVGSAARAADVACGPGADIAAWLEHASHVTAVDKTAHFLADVQARFGGEDRVLVRQGDMRDIGGPYDVIWCAGAAYIVGVVEALTAWRGALAAGGVVAFSEPCLFDGAGEAAVAFWDGYAVRDAAGIADWVAEAGYEVLDSRVVSDAAWEAYYRPMEARIAQLRGDAGLKQVLEEAEGEIADWRRLRRQTGYLLSVVRPL